MRKTMVDTQTYLARLSIVKSGSAQGKGIPELMAALDEQGLFAAQQTHDARYAVTQRLLATVRSDNAERLRLTREGADESLIEYRERHALIFSLAIEARQLEVARSVSRDLARAGGIDVDRPVGVEQADLQSIMFTMKARSREKEAPPQSLVIDISPDTETE